MVTEKYLERTFQESGLQKMKRKDGTWKQNVTNAISIALNIVTMFINDSIKIKSDIR